ncbi:Uma2 family endonuclease [Nocardia bovistercoris]|uniref:Uma2 family endonuclease n=1 Tax=Nocardia bovistercoris TaxID=2785916 RepID=A0A931N4N4_9NOCA|nr:Uma2 family endonuclease [Nocardia bovistercoris]MBH0779044.1 Uma2 family endonuclease [Nocardia bovistercoris]
MSTAIPQWMYPPRDTGWEADDLDLLPPDAPRHIELLDGALIFNTSPRRSWRDRMIRRLTAALEKAVPPGWTVEAQMTIKLNHRSRPEPDIIAARVPYAPDRTRFLPDEVELIVEIVSAESEDRDRRYKPRLYAEAGLRHFWRIEDEAGLPVVHTYELDDTTGCYVATGVHRDRLSTPVPFAIDIELAVLAH